MTARSFASSARIASSSAISAVSLVELLAQVLTLELGEAAQRHVENVRGLDLGERERLELQRVARGRGVRAATNERDDRVDHVERAQQTLDDVRALARFVEPVLRTPGDDLDLVRDVVRQRVAQAQQTRNAVDQREQVDREVGLHRRVLVEQVEHDLRVRVALEVDDEPHRVARRLVANVADAFDPALVDDLGDLLTDDLGRRLVGQLGDDDAHRAAASLDDLRDRARMRTEPRPVS